MCGVVGLYNPKNIPLSNLPLMQNKSVAELAKGMLGLISHRGPDEMGILEFGQSFIANARLSIVDLEHGTQPLANETEDLWIAYNGEIYDSQELGENLKKQGHKFRTRSDTEVIVHLYEEFGEEFVSSLNGEFAFMLYDKRASELVLVRDPFGIKPLYYAPLGSGAYLISSEIKPIFWALGIQRPKLSLDGFAETLQAWAPVPPRTHFEGIYQLPPSVLAKIDKHGELTWKRYSIMEPSPGVPQKDSGGVVDLLDRSVQRRLVADVPVGVYLSGGLDSTIVSALASKHLRTPLKSFSVSFEDKQFDESDDQVQVSRMFGTEHHAIRIGENEIVKNFVPAVLGAEAAVFRSAFVPMYILSRLVRETGIKVVLTGEGSDELFGGYDIFKEYFLLSDWAREPESEKCFDSISNLYPYLPQFQGHNRRFLLPFYRGFISKMSSTFAGHSVRWSNYSALSGLLVNPPADPAENSLANLMPDLERMGGAEVCRQVELLTLLHGYLLSSQGDRMVSQNSVEARLPFLDRDVARFALSTPVREFMPNLKEKEILYREFHDQLPTFLQKKSKTPYLAPDAELFFRHSNDFEWQEYLSSESIKDAEIFQIDQIKNLVSRLKLQFDQGKSFSRRDNSAFFTVLSGLILRNRISEELAPKDISAILKRHIRIS